MILKVSFAYFVYNLIMAGAAALFPARISDFIESNLPLKGGWLSLFTYLLFYTLDEGLLVLYNDLLQYTCIPIAILELTQVTNCVFKLSRAAKAKINLEGNLWQTGCLLIMAVTVLSAYLALSCYWRLLL